ncbi:hypothetical protein EHQ53_01280 [Leptospira langatensis]|uniref:Uncharacterized protein n=1 Tax=Leptospira langatensis TaxID=2484983 RepID=A0A5F1ZX86_9LEPT|nr:hypothetical protein [Leptospira langatensis]TGJ98384.1 hypothetical protein EHO57_17420 [Leptospira langatensis]TGL43298.1 hypothetical protein EHQ53_01280 [Leptospira langatensis]
MHQILTIVTLALLLAFIAGLKKPEIFSKWIKDPTRKKTSLLFGIPFIISLALFGAFSPPKYELSKEEIASLSEEEQIKLIVKKQIGENALKKIDITRAADGLLGIEIEFDAKGTLDYPKKLRIDWIKTKMAESYISIYKNYKNVGECKIGAFFPMKDNYGNGAEIEVYITYLAKEEADKVNWNAEEWDLKANIMPRIWMNIAIHPEFRL